MAEPDPKDVGKKEESIKRKKKAKNPKKEEEKKILADPMKIIERILAKSSFKKAELSQIVDQKFYEASDYHEELSAKLDDIVYEPTVGQSVDDAMDVNISVLPLGFDDLQVNLRPSAVTRLTCIHDKPAKRWTRQKKKGKKPQRI